MSDETAYFDCNASFGRPRGGIYAPCPEAHMLEAELDWVGVGNALVHHALMIGQSPVVGNAELARQIAGRPRLAGSWALLPPQTQELAIDRLFSDMSALNIRALWAFPEEHRYLLNRVTFGPLLDEVAERRIPLFIPRKAGGPRPGDTYHMLTQLLSEYPSLIVVLAAHGPWGEDRFFRPLLERFPGLYLDISRYELDGGLAELVFRYGPNRLLYGSNFPHNSMGGPRLMLARAAVGDEARQAIAGGNLVRLLREEAL